MEEEEEESEDEDDSFGPKKAKEEESDDPVVRKFSFRPSRWWRHIMHCWRYYFCSGRIFSSTKCIDRAGYSPLHYARVVVLISLEAESIEQQY